MAGTVEYVAEISPRVTKINTEDLPEGTTLSDLFKSLLRSPHVTHLSITKREITAAVGAELAYLLRETKTITYLRIEEGTIPEDAAVAIFDGLAENTTIIELSLINTEFGKMPAALASIAGAILNARITGLTFHDSAFDAAGVDVLAGAIRTAPYLQLLSVGRFGINDEEVKKILDAAEANRNDPAAEERRNAIVMPLDNRGITSVTFSECDALSKVGFDYIAEFIRVAQNVSELRFFLCDIGPTNVGIIAAALINVDSNYNPLPKTTNLQSLTIANTPLRDDGAVILANALQYNNSLYELVLNDCNMFSKGIGEIVRATAGRLELLSLSGNHVGNAAYNVEDPGVDAIVRMISSTTELKQLMLDRCSIGERTIDRLVRGDLETGERFNGVESPGQVFTGGLIRNKTVVKLELSGNSLGIAGMQMVAYLISQNKTIRSIELYKNIMTLATLNAFIIAMERNRSVIELGIEPQYTLGESLDPERLAVLIGYIERNKTVVPAITREFSPFWEARIGQAA